MKLSSKALRFTISAIQQRADELDQLADDETAHEDARADAGNDMLLYREIQKTFEAELARVLADPDAH